MQDAKKIVKELKKRRKERQCIPNTRGYEGPQRSGESNMMTAIGFELARRNARMILDRSPEDEPLIPPERTKIRMEMRRKKARGNFNSGFESPYDYNPVNNTKEIGEESIRTMV